MTEINPIDKLPSSYRRHLQKTFEYTKNSDGIGNTYCSYHSASIIYKNKIMCYGVNKTKTHPMQNEYKNRPDRNYIHSEIDALVKFINLYGNASLNKCDMIVVRKKRGGEQGLSKPCPGCEKAIRAFGLRKVYYT